MKKLTLLLICTIIFAGCSSIPTKVDEALLKEITPEEDKMVLELETKIVGRRKELNQAKEVAKNSDKKLKTDRQKLTLLEKEQEVLTEQKKLHQMNENASALADTEEKVKKNSRDLIVQGKLVEYSDKKLDYDKAHLEVKNAELALLISELNYEHSLIAKKYQLKIKKQKEKESGQSAKKKEEPGFFDKLFKKGDGTIDVDKYRKYFQKQKEGLTEARKELLEAKNKMEKSRADYDKTLSMEGK